MRAMMTTAEQKKRKVFVKLFLMVLMPFLTFSLSCTNSGTESKSASETGSISGAVYERDRTTPVVNALVSAYSDKCETVLETAIGSAYTNESGEYMINGLPTGNVYIKVSFSASSSSGQSYTSNFPNNEDPISEGSTWLLGKTDGLDWADVYTSSGKAHGKLYTTAYADPTAILKGTWGPDQVAEAKVFSQNQTSSQYQEVELRLRTKITAHSVTGYEINFRCLKTSEAYCEIVRWNGDLGDFTYLAQKSGTEYGVQDGDIIKATITGHTIKAYINGLEVSSGTDDTFTEGNPGIGFYGSPEIDYGFSNFSASSDITNTSEWYDDKFDCNEASPVAVNAGSNTSNVNFAL
jgi:hypothetical protein